MKKVVIVQCRLSSTRLPGKALKYIGEKTVLERTLESMKKVSADDYYVAVDYDSAKELAPFVEKAGFKLFAGSLENVLNRFCQCIKESGAQIVVRATADNPFLFYEAAQYSLDYFEQALNKGEKIDYLTLTGLPHGSGVEVFSGESLLEAEKNTKDPYDQEHAGPALYRHTDKFNCVFLESEGRFNHPSLRSTIDTYSDYVRALSVFNYLEKKGEVSPYSCSSIVEALESHSVRKPLILVPCVKKGCGTGHFKRCVSLAKELVDTCIPFLLIDRSCETLENLDSLLEEEIKNGLGSWQIIEQYPQEIEGPVVITDGFVTSQENMLKFSANGTVFSLDEGGDSQAYSDYLIDVIPPLKEKELINVFEPLFMDMPENIKKEHGEKVEKILVAYGGEDPASLSVPSCIKMKTLFPEAQIDCISRGEKSVEGVNFISPVQNLKEQLFQWDLVVTHYGLTAWEAKYAGCRVVLGATTELHKKLAKKYGFLDLETVTAKDVLTSEVETDGQTKRSLSAFISDLSHGTKLNCPVCGKKDNADPVLERNVFRTYRKCSSCGMKYIAFTCEEKQREYSKDYFFQQYKDQYGKTYKEDFEHIKSQCDKRIENISRILALKEKSVLDIGCAYGPFLKAASDSSFKAYGTDICDDAVEYVKNELGFQAVTSAFPEIDVNKAFGKTGFSVVTMWYVIEHFQDLDSVLKKVSELVSKGGVFAFSTPNALGVSGRRNTHNFYVQSPSDHYSVWDFESAKKVMAKYGFKVVKTVSTGHHPERFPYVKKNGVKNGSFIWKCIMTLSRLKKLGDTMEVYCIKV